MKDERDTQKMEAHPQTPASPSKPAAAETPQAIVYKYHTSPGPTNDPDRQLLEGLSRRRDDREERAETIGKLLDELGPPVTTSPPPPIDPAPVARPVHITHVYSLSTKIFLVGTAMAIGVLVVAVLIASRAKSRESSVVVAVSSTSAARVASASTSPAPAARSAAPLPIAPPIAPASIVRPPGTVASHAHSTTTASSHAASRAPAAATSAAPASTRHDSDIMHAPEDLP